MPELLSLVLGAFTVLGTSTCPSPAEVRAELARLDFAPIPIDATVRLNPRGDGVLLELTLGSDPEPIANRRLSGDDCPKLARRVALLIEAWAAQIALPEATRSSLEKVPSDPDLQTNVPWPPPATTAPAASSGGEADSFVDRSRPTSPTALPPTRRQRSPWVWKVSGVLLGSVSAAGLSPAGSAAFALAPATSGFAGKVGVLTEGSRTLNLGSGGCIFARNALFAAFEDRFLLPDQFELVVGVTGSLALLTGGGIGFATDHSIATTSLGVGGALMLAKAFRGLQAFALVWPTVWQAQPVTAEGQFAVNLPQFELFAGVGLAFGND